MQFHNGVSRAELRAPLLKPNPFRIIAIVFLCLLSVVPQAQSQSFNKQQVLLEKVQNSPDQKLAIILRLKSPTANAASVRTKLLAQRSHSVAADEFESIKRIRAFKYSPMVAMSVNSEELLALLNDPDVDVFENSIKRPSLSQSLNLVYPTRNVSPFHGNNEWAVAVIDTGIEKSHPFLTGKVVSEACYSNGGDQVTTSSLCPGGVKESIATGSGVNCTLGLCGHGTQVAGIAVGNSAASDGIARDGKLIAIQVYSEFTDEGVCGFGVSSCIGAYTEDIIKGLERVYELRNSFKIASVNLSLGSDELFSGSCDEQPERDVIDRLTSAGIAVVVSTGNSGNTSQMQSPACITNAIAVAATSDSSDTVWSGNNISNQLDVFAPGVNIATSALNGTFQAGTGTSFAAPHVAGAWAAMKHASPTLSVTQGEALMKSVGPVVSQHSVSRRRLFLTSILNTLVPGSQTSSRPPGPALDSEAVLIPAVMLLLFDD